MKFKNLLFISTSLLIFGACSSDDLQIDVPDTDTEQPEGEDPEEEQVPGNNAPEAFNLITLDNGAADIDLNPLLTWDSATDPDGDELTYKLLLDITASPETILAEDITTTEFSITEGLERNKVYYWKVVANDGNGGKTESTEIFSFSTKGYTFSETALTANAEFSKRRNHSITEFNGKLWMIGGQNDNSNYKDVWSSVDGKTWELVAEDPFGFGGKNNHTAIVFKNKFWIIGGGFSDIWSSTNGIDWVRNDLSGPFGSREGHSTLVYDNKLWVIGGTKVTEQMNDVWYSEDGITWTEAASSTQFSPRTDHTTVVFNDKMYLMGGTTIQDFSPLFYNDIYTSTDGINWTEVATESVFEIRANHTSLVYDNKMWVIGGWQAVTNQETMEQDVVSFADVWYSDNGTQWNKLSGSDSYTGRLGHASTVFENKILISGGLNIDQDDNLRSHYNDVWVIE
ncbi:Kelch repeat-containing protein [Zobellia nedashkovskayae]